VIELPALQVGSPEFKPQSHQTNKQTKLQSGQSCISHCDFNVRMEGVFLASFPDVKDNTENMDLRSFNSTKLFFFSLTYLN
jgi:hypothetical protein